MSDQPSITPPAAQTSKSRVLNVDLAEHEPFPPAFTGHPSLKISNTIKKLKPPGPDSNYLYWSWILDMHFSTVGVSYIIDSVVLNPELSPTFAQDNRAVCCVIAQTIDPANIRVIRQLCKNARSIWAKLCRAHQDNSSGGVMYSLWKLSLFRMEGDDIDAHLEAMAKVFE